MHQSGPIHLLHVDDDPHFADLTRHMLEAEDERFDITSVHDLDAALEVVGDGVDCIVSDYQMPNADGLEFLRVVRDDYPALPFILFTGKGTEDIAAEAVTEGVDDYMQKDSGSDQYSVLANRVRNLVAQQRAQTSYREVFQRAAVGMAIHDIDTGELVDANDRLCEMLNYPDDEITEQTLADLSAGHEPYTGNQMRELVEDAASGKEQRFKWIFETSEGDLFPVKVSMKLAEINGVDCILANIVALRDFRSLE